MTTNSPRPKNDLFADIAGKGPAGGRLPLIEPQPPPLPDIRLPSTLSDPKAAFRPAARLATAAALTRALAAARRKHAPFLHDLAPPPPMVRKILPLDTFDWRLETESDRLDFSSVLRGSGKWETVRLPHYGGPLGQAAAFYRTRFRLSRAMLAQGSLFACFDGVDYKAQVFLNGYFLGSHEGFFAPFEFDFTACARAGENTLVVKVENDAICMGNNSWGDDGDAFEGDKIYAATGPGYDDPDVGWHHCPPGMGIYQGVRIEARAKMFISDLFVRPLPEKESAEVWIEVWNTCLERHPLQLSLSVFGQNFKKTICRNLDLPLKDQAGPRVNYYRFTMAMPRHRRWEPDSPWLYQVQARLMSPKANLLDTAVRQFGMRSFRMDTENEPRGRMFLNGREIRLRGANTMGFEQQDVMRRDWKQLVDDILLAKLCNMNFWRLTQRPVQREIYDYCDRLGLLTQTDLPLFGVLRRNQFRETVRQAGEMERLVRSHPCNIMVSYINEPFPNAQGKPHRHLLRNELERFFLAADQTVLQENPDRVIKAVDGDYDPPAPGLPDNHCYTCWYNGHGVEFGKLHKGFWQRVKSGWLYGCGEFGAEGLDPADLMRRRYPKAWLPQTTKAEPGWSPNQIVKAQTGRFHYMFFDTQRRLDDWVRASQAHQAWATRIMTEAFRRDNRMNTFAIHLFIDAWPSGWMKTIMDCERRPKPAFFAYREALTPLMANIRTDRWTFTARDMMRFEFWVCNDTHDIPAGAKLRYQLEVDGKVVFSRETKAKVQPCQSVFQGFVDLPAPAVRKRTPAMLRLALTDRVGKMLHDAAVALTIFPAAPREAKLPRVTVLGARDGKAARLARELGLAPFFARTLNHNLILVDDFTCFEKRRAEIEAAVRSGAKAVFLELPAGEYRLAGDKLTIEACGMGARHFVSRATGHPLAAGFEPNDFRLWHDPSVGRITPLLETCFRAKAWTPVLATGNGGWGGDWRPALAAAEKCDGAGAWRICQVKLAGRTKTNPVAELFARRLTKLD